MENKYIGWIAKKGSLDSLRGALVKKDGVVFLRGGGGDTPMHTMAI